jgi:hypothetical protein
LFIKDKKENFDFQTVSNIASLHHVGKVSFLIKKWMNGEIKEYGDTNVFFLRSD